MNMKYLKSIISILTVLIALQVNAQTWEVPAKKSKLKNPTDFNKKTLKEGKSVYMTNCKSCHGDLGKNNGLPLVPKPVDPLSDQMQKNTDGDLFYKITEGRGAMPSFKSVLSDNERWSVISYFRSENPNYKAPKAKTVVVSKKDEVILDNAKIILTANREESIVTATVLGNDGSSKPAPVKDAEIGFFVKRTFGLLPVGEKDLTTDENGLAKIEFPKDLPGDADGNITMIVRLLDEEKYPNVSQKQKLNIGKVTIPKNLTDQRALWNKMSKIPIWLLLTYLGLVLGTWGGIFYIVGQIIKLKKVS